MQKNKILGTNLYVTFSQISQIIHKTVSGIQGGLYSLFFYYVAQVKYNALINFLTTYTVFELFKHITCFRLFRDIKVIRK